MSASQAWDEAFQRLRNETGTVPASVARGLLRLLSIDNGRHVPRELAAGMETAVYRLAGLRVGGGMTGAEESLMREIAEYERARWASLLADEGEGRGHGAP